MSMDYDDRCEAVPVVCDLVVAAVISKSIVRDATFASRAIECRF